MGEHQHILLAGSSGDVLEPVRRAIVARRPGDSVVVVHHAAALDAIVAGRSFDGSIICTDLSPTFGPAVIRRAIDAGLRGPVLATSQDGSQSMVVACMRAGAMDFLTRQELADPDRLLERLDAATTANRHAEQERRKVERRRRFLARLADTDPLTDLFNRRYLDRCLRDQRWSNDRRRELACVMIDIDHFKTTNDHFGHRVGDDLLRAVARELREATCQADLAVRIGGEEFLVIKPSMSLYQAWMWAELTRTRIETQVHRAVGHPHPVTISAGVAAGAARDFGQAMIEQADRAMYLAKQTGRNRVCTVGMAPRHASLAA